MEHPPFVDHFPWESNDFPYRTLRKNPNRNPRLNRLAHGHALHQQSVHLFFRLLKAWNLPWKGRKSWIGKENSKRFSTFNREVAPLAIQSDLNLWWPSCRPSGQRLANRWQDGSHERSLRVTWMGNPHRFAKTKPPLKGTTHCDYRRVYVDL